MRFDLRDDTANMVFSGRVLDSARGTGENPQFDTQGPVVRATRGTIKKVEGNLTISHLDSFVQLHVLPNGNTLAVHSITHDITVFDASLKFVRKVLGVQRMPSSWEFMEPQLTRQRRVHVCRQELEQAPSDKIHLPWLSGVNSTSVLDLKTFKSFELQGMWNCEGQPSFANVLAGASDQTVVFGIGQLEQSQTLHMATVAQPTRSKSVMAKSLIPQSTLAIDDSRHNQVRSILRELQFGVCGRRFGQRPRCSYSGSPQIRPCQGRLRKCRLSLQDPDQRLQHCLGHGKTPRN